jgi:hypothetical protein
MTSKCVNIGIRDWARGSGARWAIASTPNQNEVGEIINVSQAKIGGNNF